MVGFKWPGPLIETNELTIQNWLNAWSPIKSMSKNYCLSFLYYDFINFKFNFRVFATFCFVGSSNLSYSSENFILTMCFD